MACFCPTSSNGRKSENDDQAWNVTLEEWRVDRVDFFLYFLPLPLPLFFKSWHSLKYFGWIFANDACWKVFVAIQTHHPAHILFGFRFSQRDAIFFTVFSARLGWGTAVEWMALAFFIVWKILVIFPTKDIFQHIEKVLHRPCTGCNTGCLMPYQYMSIHRRTW